MIIDSAEIWTQKLPLTRPYVIATREVSTVDLNFVCLKSRTKAIGLGCAAPTAVTSETAQDCLSAMESAANECLKGQDLTLPQELARKLRSLIAPYPSAIAALDIAIYDLFARSKGAALATVLGSSTGPLPTSITIGILPLDETLEEASEYLGRGFKCLKVKLGLDFEQDLERLRALRSTCPSSIHIRVDANQGYTLQQTEQLIHASHALNLELIEQPLPRGNESEMLQLPETDRSLMAADESLHGPADALQLAADKSFGIWNIKLMKCGGITGAMDLANLAHISAIHLMWGCMDESVISIAAALHTAYACSQTRYLDLDGSFDLSQDVGIGGFTLSEGTLYVTEEPGLGVTLH